MSQPIAIDSNVLVAILDNHDTWHARAIALRDALASFDTRAVYFDCVVNEAIAVMGRRTEEQKRSDQFIALLDQLISTIPTREITWVTPKSQQWFDESIKLCREAKGTLNFHDALIAIACRESHIEFVASFDPDLDKLPWLRRIQSVEQAKSLLAKTKS